MSVFSNLLCFKKPFEGTCEFRSYSCASWSDFDGGFCLDGWNKNGQTIFPEMGWYSGDYIGAMPQKDLNNLYLKTRCIIIFIGFSVFLR